LSIKNKKYAVDSSSRILHFYRILKAKDFSSLAFFLAQMEKESPEFKMGHIKNLGIMLKFVKKRNG
jgi:hypothetical protein